ncbi:MAG: hypothetical protein ACLFM8_08865, partial [Halobacteriales archaeon]
MVTIIDGILGGLIATNVMTAFQLVLGGGPPPTARFWSKYVGSGNPEESRPHGRALHLLYGTIAGAVLAAGASGLSLFAFGTVVDDVVWGLAYGVV